jgi:polar amino acid transport system substrate-binding protein
MALPDWAKRVIAGAGAMALLPALTLIGVCRAAPVDDRNPHDEALNALVDIRAAISELTAASDLTRSGSAPYKQAARRAIDALVGRRAADNHSQAGEGDDAGALAHLHWLKMHSGSRAWSAALQGVLVNTMAAESRLEDALHAIGLDQFQSKTSGALEALLVGVGRDSDTGVLGGLQGALATTDLGVPRNATIVSGCAPPLQAPAYGVVDGHLMYIAIPHGASSIRLPEAIGVSEVSIRDGVVVLHTSARELVAKLCPAHESGAAAVDPGEGTTAVARLYTVAQAQAGEQVYAQRCAICHGDRLQGKSAPAIAGASLLSKARILNWSVEDLRQLVVTTMPRDNPGSLSPQQYADVLAYLLAVDCYPAGPKPFPTAPTAQLESTHLQRLESVKPDNADFGTCSLQHVSQKGAGR